MTPDKLLGVITIITLFTLALCAIGIGIFVLPFVALLWIFYFAYIMGIGGAILGVGCLVALAIYFGLRHRKN